MKVEDKKFNFVEFQDLKAGEIFMYFNDYYIKRNVERGIEVKENKSLAIDLNTGIEVFVSPTTEVIKVNAKIVIE